MVVLSYSVIFYIYIPGKLGHCFHYWCSVYCICKWADTLWPVDRVRLFADYTISLSSLCRLIWRHWTTKMLVRYMLPSVWLRLRQFSQSSFIFDLWGCVSSAYPILLWWSFNGFLLINPMWVPYWGCILKMRSNKALKYETEYFWVHVIDSFSGYS